MAGKNKHLIMERDHMEKLYNSPNPLVKFLFNKRLDVITHSIPVKGNVKILDAGCGEGHLLKNISTKNENAILYGADVTDVALRQAKKRVAKARVSKQDITHLKYPSNTFDVVICTEVLEHVYGYKKAINELKRVSKKGGMIIVSFPNETNLTVSRFFLGRHPIKVPDHVNSFNIRKIKKEFNIPLLKSFNLPLNLPFSLSLVTVCVFVKK